MHNVIERNHAIEMFITTGDQSMLTEKSYVGFCEIYDKVQTIKIDSSLSYQKIDGFGYTLTGGSADLIQAMDSGLKLQLLYELFSCEEGGNCISYLRISLGASDLSKVVFSYCDLPSGTVDVNLTHFNLSEDTLALLPVLREILKINPDIKIMASPWSAPVWMKSNKSSIGGSLLPAYYDVYAAYFVRYIRAMKKEGITIDAVTIQNEPQHGGNNPSMVMSAKEQADFIKNHLGPKFKNAGIKTKIIIWDHNCDMPDYPIGVLNDPDAKVYIDGTAFHLYAGDISALSAVQSIHPDRNIYFTEQWTDANGSFEGDLMWHMKNVIIGSTRNQSKIALEWNLANDPRYEPHTPGGCTRCKGALTIDGNLIKRNVSYYIIAHVSRFVPPGSVRIFSSAAEDIPNVAFLTPLGKKVLIVLNENKHQSTFNIACGNRHATVTVPEAGVATIVW